MYISQNPLHTITIEEIYDLNLLLLLSFRKDFYVSITLNYNAQRDENFTINGHDKDAKEINEIVCKCDSVKIRIH